MNHFMFNEDTAYKVLAHSMTSGPKVRGDCIIVLLIPHELSARVSPTRDAEGGGRPWLHGFRPAYRNFTRVTPKVGSR